MKKMMLASLFLLAGCSLFAHAGGDYFAILPGHQFSGEHVDSGFVGSLDFVHSLGDNLGLHVGLWDARVGIVIKLP